MYLAVSWIQICLKISVKMMTYLTTMIQRRRKFLSPHLGEEEAVDEEEVEEETRIRDNLLVMDVGERLRDPREEEDEVVEEAVEMGREEGEIKEAFRTNGMK